MRRLIGILGLAVAGACATSTGSLIRREIVWAEAVGPRVTVRADVDPDELVKIVGEIEQYMDALEAVAFEFEERPKERIGVVMFTREEDYNLSHEQTWRGGHYIHWAMAGVELPASVFVLGEWDAAHRQTVVHELTHHYVHYYYPSAPPWLNEGLAQYFATITLHGDRVTLGEPGKGRLERPWTPSFAALFAMNYSQFHLEGSELGEVEAARQHIGNYQAAWMAVHFLMTSGDPWRGRLDAYLLGLARGQRSEDAFAAAFADTTVEALEKATLDQFSYKRIPSLRTAFQTPPAPAATARVLRPAEVDVLRAWYRSTETGTDRPRAYAELAHAIELEPDLTEAYLWRGHLFRDDERLDEAREAYARARALSPDDTAVLIAELDLALTDAAHEASSRAVVERDVPELAKRARSARALDTVARGLCVLGKLEGALGFAVRATTADVGCASCWALRSDVLWALERREEALAALDVGILQARSPRYAAELGARRSERVAAQEVERVKAQMTAP